MSSRSFQETQARAVAAAFDSVDLDIPEVLGRAEQWMSTVDTQSHVGSIHHTVPKFHLQRWAKGDQVQVYSRLERTFSVRNIKDLGVKNFYTFINTSGARDSSYESLLGAVEAPAATTISRLLAAFVQPSEITSEELYLLADLAAFQAVRTTRRRREIELWAEWHAKTLASGRVEDTRLRRLQIVPHQNQSLRLAMSMARHVAPFIVCRPVALIVLDSPRLLLGDEPLVANVGPDDGQHHPDCFLTDAEIRRRAAKELRKKPRLRRPAGRVVHFRPTVAQGLGVAYELVLPISPRTALWWGPLTQQVPYDGPIERVLLDLEDSQRFAELINSKMAEQALEWVVSTPDDTRFTDTTFPEVGPLMKVCDGDNAAALAVNETPARFRPARLTQS